MTRKKIITSVALLLAVSLGLAVNLSPASADLGSGPPIDCYTKEFYDSKGNRYGQSCFQWYGDDQWVNDSTRNGRRVGVDIQTNYGKYRRCENTHGGSTWHRCYFDHKESGCVRFRGYEYDSSTSQYYNVTSWTSWRKVSTGGAC
ncbi:MAG: hypothetical protein ACRDT6_07745 [Micromonosporaceae bacterium]